MPKIHAKALIAGITLQFILLLAMSSHAALATNPMAASDTLKMKAALCRQWDCPVDFMKATGLEKTLDRIGAKSSQEALTAIQDDVQYFAEKVIFTEPGNEPDQLYKNVQIRILPGDQLTIVNGTKETLLNTQGHRLFNVDNFQAHYLKINGRRLITKALYTAHHATQILIIEGAITPPLNELASATNARLLNKALLAK